jgi:hypothetical protein
MSAQAQLHHRNQKTHYIIATCFVFEALLEFLEALSDGAICLPFAVGGEGEQEKHIRGGRL